MGDVTQNLEEEATDQEVEPTRGPLIPDGMARELFDAGREVIHRGAELEAAQETVKLRRAALAKAQAHVFELIQEAESGQSRLFNEK